MSFFGSYPSSGGSSTAAGVSYDNTASGLSATDVQAAIDELAASSGGSLANDTFLTGRNFADDGDVNLIKVDTLDHIQIGNATDDTDTHKIFLGSHTYTGMVFDRVGKRVDLTAGHFGVGGQINLVADFTSIVGGDAAIAPSLLMIDATTGRYAGIKAPNTLAVNWTMTLPPNDGTSGQFLKTDGSGVTTWDTPTGGAADDTGAVQFNTADALNGDATTFFWDNAAKRLAIGSNAAASSLEVTTGNTGDDGITITAPYTGWLRFNNTDIGADRRNWRWVTEQTDAGSIQLQVSATAGATPSVSVLNMLKTGFVGINETSPNQMLSVAGDVSFKGHLVSIITTGPGLTAGADSGVLAVASDLTSSNDGAGIVRITTGTGATNGQLIEVAFDVAYGSAPSVMVMPVGANSGTLTQVWLHSVSTTGFIVAATGVVDATAYDFHYQVVGLA